MRSIAHRIFPAVAFLVIASSAAPAQQLRLSLNMSPRPSPYLAEWQTRRETAILTVTNTGNASAEAKLRAKVSLDGNLRAETKTASMPVLDFPPGVSTFYADQIIPYDAVRFTGGVEQTAIRTGMLPAGNYELCVDLVPPDDGRPLTQQVCRQFTLTSYQLPTLLQPENGTTIAANVKPTFRWTPVSPLPQGGAKYMLKVFELLPGQTASSLLSAGTPLYERELAAQTQLIWPAEFVLPDGEKQYAWSVQTLDQSGNPLGDRNGWAEPFTFRSSGEGGGVSERKKTQEGLRLSGFVRDFYSNEPIPNAKVTYRTITRLVMGKGANKSFAYMTSKDSLTATSDAEGRFIIEGVADKSFFGISGRASGYIQKTESGPAQYFDGELDNYLLALKPNQGAITGIVTDSITKKGLNNITVELWRKGAAYTIGKGFVIGAKKGAGVPAKGQDQLIATATTGSSVSGAAPAESQMRVMAPGGLMTNVPGSFRFSGVPADAGYYIVVNNPSYRKVTTPTFTVQAEKTSTATIRLQPKTGTIEGWVREEGTNKPLAGASVYLYSDVGISVAINQNNPGLEAGKSAGGWSPGVGNAPNNENYKQFNNSKENNSPFMTGKLVTGVGNIGSKGGDESKSGGGGKSAGAAQWSNASAWGPTSMVFGSPAPPMKPDSLPLYGPVLTDANGRFVFENVRINNPAQPTDKYAVWARTQGYYDAVKSARLSADGGKAQVTLLTKVAKGIIYGKITGKFDNAPIGAVKVELLKQGKGATAVKTAYSNPDGTYTLFNIDDGSYGGVRFSKSGVSAATAPGPIKVENGTLIKLDMTLEVQTGTIKGTVTDNKNQPMPGVMIHATNNPNISATTFIDGTFLIPNVPVGKTELICAYPDVQDKKQEVTIAKQGDTAKATIKMNPYTGSVTVLVRDAVTKSAISNAKVTLSGSKNTDLAGLATFSDIATGPKSVTVVADTASGKDYKIGTTNVTVVKDQVTNVTVELQPGGRISGKVENVATLAGLDSVKITVQGVPGITSTTASDGSFTLRNVPANVALTLLASRATFKNGKSAEITLTEGEHRQNIVIQLESSPIQTLYGFKVQVDKIEEIGGKKFVTGALIDVPKNTVMELQNASFNFPFEKIEVDNNYLPVAKTAYFEFDEVPIKIFGLKGKVTSPEDFIKVSWIDSVGAGSISGEKIALDNMIPTWIPGAKWAKEKVTWAANELPPGFLSDGSFRTNISKLGINVDGSSVSAEFYGFKVTVDYAKTKVDGTGLHYYGTLKIPGITSTIKFEDLHIVLKDPQTGSVKFEKVTVVTQPPITLNFAAFKIVDSSATWDQTGFKGKGMVELTALGKKKFNFRDLWISKDGDFLSMTVDLPPGQQTLTVLGQSFALQSLGFGTDTKTNPKKKYFVFSGKLTLSKLNKPIEFQALKFTEDGDFSGTVVFNQSVTFANVVTVQLQSVEFGKDAQKGKFVFIKGGIAFNIPMLSVQVGNFRYYENGQFTLEKIGIGFAAGPVQVAIELSWSNTIFEGSGLLSVKSVLDVSGAFRYGGANDWWIKIKANIPPVPIGPFTIVGIAGELGRQNNVWIFGFGGSVTIGAAQDAIKLDLYVKLTKTPNGPIIEGSADVIVMSNVGIGKATVTLDYPNNRFAGSIDFGWSKKGITIKAWVNIEVKSGQYWFVGAGVKADLFKLAQLDVAAYIAKNYSGYMHSFPVTYHPDHTTINGFHIDGSYTKGWNKSGSKWSLGLKMWAYVAIDNNLGVSGGFKVNAKGSFDLWIIGGSGEANLVAAVQWQNNVLKFYGNASLKVHLWVWPCNSDSKCSKLCKGCFNVSITGKYDGNSGWDFNVNW